MPEYIINTASMDIDRKNEIVRCRTGKDGKVNPNGYCAWGEKRDDD